MIFNCLCASLVLNTFGMHKNDQKIKTPSHEVVIQAKKIVIPHIPTSVSQAHQEYKQVGTHIEQAIQDLENDLLALYAETANEKQLPATIRVKKHEADAVKFFNRMIEDKEYAQLFQQVIDSWNSWQNVMIASGLAKIDNTKPTQPQISDKNDKNLIKKMSCIKNPAEFQEYDRSVAAWFAGGDRDFFKFIITNIEQHDKSSFTSQKSTILSNQKAPGLSHVWLPLAGHLQACADNFVNIDIPEKPYQTVEILSLKKHAKIAFLERCRFSLWLCQKIWARMASRDELPHIKPLLQNQD